MFSSTTLLDNGRLSSRLGELRWRASISKDVLQPVGCTAHSGRSDHGGEAGRGARPAAEDGRDRKRQPGLTFDEVLGKRRKGSVAIKYRDPKNPENTWTGRGRMPRWIAAAAKGGKAKKEDFLV